MSPCEFIVFDIEYSQVAMFPADCQRGSLGAGGVVSQQIRELVDLKVAPEHMLLLMLAAVGIFTRFPLHDALLGYHPAASLFFGALPLCQLASTE